LCTELNFFIAAAGRQAALHIKYLHAFTLLIKWVNDFYLFTLFFSFFLPDIKFKYCDVPTYGSCCNSNIEQKLSFNSKTAMERVIRDSVSKMSSTLQTRAQKFNGKY
jgi:hypothetical protein